MKIYGIFAFTGYHPKQLRYVAAVRNQKEFAELIGSSVHYVRGYAAETGNKIEVEVCTACPHTLFYEDPLHRGEYVECRRQHVTTEAGRP
jgi:hypothetical protein